MGGGFTDLLQAWISAGPRMIATPLLIFLSCSFFFHTMMNNDILSDGCHVCPRITSFLRAISIDAFCDHHFDYFFKLVLAWKTLHIMIDCSVYRRAVIVRTICSARSLSRRSQIVFWCCWFPWWRVMIIGRKTPIIFLFHSDWFLNWEWLVTGFQHDYAR